MVTIKQLVNGVNREYYLPIIQREYRWLKSTKEQKIEKYFDSLYKGYPSGNFVFYTITNLAKYKPSQLLKFTTNCRSDQVCTNPIVSRNDLVNEGRENVTLVYDGQQRITSMYIALKSGFIKGNATYNLYFKLGAVNNQQRLEDSNFKFIASDENVYIDDDRFVLLKAICELDAGTFDGFITNNNLSDNRNEIEKIYKLINSDNIVEPKVYSISNYTEDQMFTIFARLNSGVPVKREELVLSYFYDYFVDVDFRKKINDLNSDIKNDYKIDGFKPENLIASIMFFGHKPIKLSINDIDDEVSNFVKDNCGRIMNCLKESARIIYDELSFKNFEKLKLSLRYPVEIIGYYLFKKQIHKLQNGDKEAIMEFIRIYQVKEWNKGNKVIERLSRIRRFIDESNNFAEVVGRLKEFQTDKFQIFESDIDAILGLEYKSPQVHYILQLLFPDLAYGTVKFAVDHIFPKARNYAHDSKVNNIANLQFLSVNENSTVKSDQEPQEWFNSKDENEKAQLVKNGLLIRDNLDNFKNFFEKRESIIREKLTELIER